MSRRSRSRGRSLYRDGATAPVDDRATFNETIDPKRASIYKFVKQQLKVYSDSHDMEITPAQSDTWELVKSTNKLEVPFSIENIADCAVFCKEMELLLECTRVILEYDAKEFVLKIPYNDLLRSSGRLTMLNWFGVKRRVELVVRKLLIFLGLCTLLYIAYSLFFQGSYSREPIYKDY